MGGVFLIRFERAFRFSPGAVKVLLTFLFCFCMFPGVCFGLSFCFCVLLLFPLIFCGVGVPGFLFLTFVSICVSLRFKYPLVCIILCLSFPHGVIFRGCSFVSFSSCFACIFHALVYLFVFIICFRFFLGFVLQVGFPIYVLSVT